MMTDDGPLASGRRSARAWPMGFGGDAPPRLCLPLGVKRGYHMHYAPHGNAVLNNWTLDAERGYFLAPMSAASA